MSITTLNVNVLNTLIKRDCLMFLKKTQLYTVYKKTHFEYKYTG